MLVKKMTESCNTSILPGQSGWCFIFGYCGECGTTSWEWSL